MENKLKTLMGKDSNEDKLKNLINNNDNELKKSVTDQFNNSRNERIKLLEEIIGQEKNIIKSLN